MQLNYGNEPLHVIGSLIKPFRFNGQCACFIDESVDEESILALDFLFLIINGLPVPFAVEESFMRGKSWVVKFKGIDTEAALAPLLKAPIAAKESELTLASLPSLEQFIDYKIFDQQNRVIGVIHHVEQLPEQIMAYCFSNGQEVLIPLVDQFILEINDERKYIRMELPEGLLSVNAE
ncbi:MAG: rRNA processing protein RimM [Bacteroidota bacterium]|jgi:16S rRNA processing protein RimM